MSNNLYRPNTNLNKPLDERIIELFNTGLLSVAEISRALSCSRGHVNKVLKPVCPPPKSKVISKEEYENLKDACKVFGASEEDEKKIALYERVNR